jgi:hypothetical protein
MSENTSQKFRPVNATLGQAPKLGPFPADQVLPWTVIALVGYYLTRGVLGLSWLWTGLFIAWGISTWWALTGGRSWRFLSKFISTRNWTRGYARYQRLLTNNRSARSVKRKGLSRYGN